jgi:ABC-type glycerol-3-phosphate transport system permease component
MSILSVVGRRSPGMRVTIAALYTILIVGSVTMIYPFMLMLSTSITSKTDFEEYAVVPRYLYNDDVLLAKYAEEKYAVDPLLMNTAYRTEIFEFRELVDTSKPTTPQITQLRQDIDALPPEALQARLSDWQEVFARLPMSYKAVAFQSSTGMTGRSHQLYREFIEKKFDGDLKRCQLVYQEQVGRFKAIEIPRERPLFRDYVPERTDKFRDFFEFKKSLPPEHLIVVPVEQKYAEYLKARFDAKVDNLNADFGTTYKKFTEITLPETLPSKESDLSWFGGGGERAAWINFVKSKLTLSFIGVANGAQRFNAFLEKVRPQAKLKLEDWDLNVRPGVDRPVLGNMAEAAPYFYEFLKKEVRPEEIHVLSAENIYRGVLKERYGSTEKLNQKHGANYKDIGQAVLPLFEADYKELQAIESTTRLHFIARNYSEVLDYILMHGRALWNTFVLVALVMLTSLTVNPLCAYALSRFQLSYTNKILLFCLATMAFPPEVGMIPSFLMLRSFPLGKLIVGVVMGLIIFGVFSIALKGKAPLWVGMIAGAIIGFGTAMFAMPAETGNVSLLNSYYALILPGVANGFAIFMFKGFFDSLPRELYEAAAMEGAGELHMFKHITLPLCAPVIAIIGLDTFKSAYGSFMFAMLVCQKEEMWTLMVWLYQMQQWAPTYVIIAALTLAAIPVMIAILICQRFILRGIVLPSMH